MNHAKYSLPEPGLTRRAAVVTSLLAVLLASAAIAQQNSGDQKKVYRWTDEKGVVHYGDRIPPEYSRGEAAVLNNQGVTVGIRAAQKTPEQLEREAAQREVREKELQRDTFLLTTYTSVRDIEQLRDQRLQQMADARRSIEAYVDSLQGRLMSLHERVQVFRPYNDAPTARRMPDELAQDLVRTLKEVAVQRAQMAERMAEDRALRQQFQLDIDRYRMLKSKVASTR
jgi:hypothetical protein